MLTFVEFVEFRVGGCAGVFFFVFFCVCVFFSWLRSKKHTHTHAHMKKQRQRARHLVKPGFADTFAANRAGKLENRLGIYWCVCMFRGRPQRLPILTRAPFNKKTVN